MADRYAATIVCVCGRRLGIIEISGVNNHQCACGRVFTMSRPSPEWPVGHPMRRGD